MPRTTVTAKLGALLSPVLEALVRALAHVSAEGVTQRERSSVIELTQCDGRVGRERELQGHEREHQQAAEQNEELGA